MNDKEQEISNYLAEMQAKQLQLVNKIKTGLTVIGVGLVAVAVAVVVVAVVFAKSDDPNISTYWTQVPEEEIIK
jgi:Flp pilus assembly pilin Flp